MSPLLLVLERPTEWPAQLRKYLDEHHDLFLGWEARTVTAAAYDNAIYGLVDALQPYAITGWHCTRLRTQRFQDDEWGSPADHPLRYPRGNRNGW